MKIAIFCMGIIFFSCATSQFGGQGSTHGRRGDASFNEEFDPVPLDEEIKITPRDREKPQEIVTDPVTIPREEDAEQEMTQGFRVQLLSGKDPNAAMEAKRRAIFLFEEAVYLDFETPYYKLRVGDCRSREEAEKLQRDAEEKGFRNPWIVPSRVYVKKGKQSDG